MLRGRCQFRPVSVREFKVVASSVDGRIILHFTGVVRVNICQHMFLSWDEITIGIVDIGTKIRQPLRIDYGVDGANENHPIPEGP